MVYLCMDGKVRYVVGLEYVRREHLYYRMVYICMTVRYMIGLVCVRRVIHFIV